MNDAPSNREKSPRKPDEISLLLLAAQNKLDEVLEIIAQIDDALATASLQAAIDKMSHSLNEIDGRRNQQ